MQTNHEIAPATVRGRTDIPMTRNAVTVLVVDDDEVDQMAIERSWRVVELP